MGLVNHLLAVMPSSSGPDRQIDIQFSYGDVREFCYRVGDSLRFSADEQPAQALDAIVPGIAVMLDEAPHPPAGEPIPEEQVRYFRIVVMTGRIVSYSPTTREDFKALESVPQSSRSAG